jgi:hypothetical protein
MLSVLGGKLSDNKKMERNETLILVILGILDHFRH